MSASAVWSPLLLKGGPMRHLRPITLALLLLSPSLLVAQEVQPSYPPPAEVKAALQKLLDRPRVLFNVKDQEAKRDDETGLVFERLSIAVEKRPDGELERVPMLIVRPE